MNHPSKMAMQLVGIIIALFSYSSSQAQGDPAGFAVTLPDSIKWAPNPAAPGVVNAVLLGNPGKPEPYVVRAKFPDAYRLTPHTHPDQRIYTVVSGTWHMGFGVNFDQSKLKLYPAGTVFVLPANTSHFNLTQGETVIQINGVGPTATSFVNPADDPRKK
jgi:quercetin dioxygenase-like cupin family protein